MWLRIVPARSSSQAKARAGMAGQTGGLLPCPPPGQGEAPGAKTRGICCPRGQYRRGRLNATLGRTISWTVGTGLARRVPAVRAYDIGATY